MGWNHLLLVFLIFNVLLKNSMSEDDTDKPEESEEPEKENNPDKPDKPKKPGEEIKTITIVENDNGNQRTTTVTGSMNEVTTTKYGSNRFNIFNPFSWIPPRSNKRTIQIE